MHRGSLNTKGLNVSFTQAHEGAPTVDDVLGICSEFPELEKLNKSSQTLATYSEPDWTPPMGP